MSIITPPSLEFELAKIAAERGLRVSPGTLDANWFNQGKLLGQKVKGANLGKEFADEVARRAAKEAAKEVPKQAGFLEGIANFVGEWLLKRPAQWIENLLRKVPGLGGLLDFGKKHIGTAAKFFANIGGFIAELPIIKPVLRFFSTVDRFLGKVANWGMDKLGRFLSHPAVTKILGVLGLIADVFSIFSSISQWNELSKAVENQDKFADQIRRLMDVEAARTRDSLRKLRNDVELGSRINQGQNQQLVKIDGLIKSLNTNYSRINSDLSAQKASLTTLRNSLRDAVTATAVTAITGTAINRVVNQYQLTRVPSVIVDVERLKKTPARLNPQDLAPFDNRIRSIEGQIPDIRNAIRSIPAGKNGRDGRDGRNGIDGKPGITTTIVRREEVPIRVVETKVVPTIDPTIKAEILAVKAIAQQAQVQAQAANTKLGAEIPNGGISQFLLRMQNFAEKAWRFTRADKVLAALNFLTALHNAIMLSNALGQTLGELTGLALNVLGIRDENGNQLDVNQIIGKSFQDLIKSIVGEQTFNDTARKWAVWNKIISSANNVIWTVRSMTDSLGEIVEWIGENTGKIGNALKRWAVVGENAYNWLPERMRRQDAWTRKLDRIRNGTESLDDAASSLTGVLSEVRSIQEEYGELQTQKAELEKAIKEGEKLVRQDNDQAKNEQTEAKTSSQSPNISSGDLGRG